MKKVLRSPYLHLALSQTMVGVGIVCARYLAHRIPTFLYLEFRFCTAALALLFVYATLPHASLRQKMPYRSLARKDWGLIIAQAVSAGALFNILMVTGLHYTTASIAGIITSALPMVIAILSYLFLKERLSKTTLLCIGMATLGLLLINLAHFSSHTQSAHSLLGTLIILVALFPEAFYYVLVKMGGRPLPVLPVSILVNVINALVILPMALWTLSTHPELPGEWSDYAVTVIAGLASAAFFLFWFLGSKVTTASTSALFTALMPISTLAIASLTLGETLTTAQWLGMGFVLAALLINARLQKQ